MASGMPSDVAQWGSTLSPGADLTVPGSTEKLGGWQVGKPRRQYMNWWQQAVYRWLAWLIGMESQDFVWTGDQDFTAATVHIPFVSVPLRYVGAGGEPAFQNSWSNPGSGNRKLAFWKDINGAVHIEGNPTGGSAGTVAFTLPVGYRPLAVTALEGNAPTNSVTIATNGDVTLNGTGAVGHVMFRPDVAVGP